MFGERAVGPLMIGICPRWGSSSSESTGCIIAFLFFFLFFNTGGILNLIHSLSIKFEATATLIRLYIYNASLIKLSSVY